MNSFHELNMMTSRGDINGALSLINGWSESVARKIMKKAGYPVPSEKGRSFWLWVQQTLIQAARDKRCGYQQRLSRSFTLIRQEAENHYDDYVRMMAELNRSCEAEFPSDGKLSVQEKSISVDTDTKVGVRLSGHPGGVVDTDRNTEPATMCPVTVFRLRKTVCDVVTHETENRRTDGMRFHVLPLFKKKAQSFSKRPSAQKASETLCFRHFKRKHDRTDRLMKLRRCCTMNMLATIYIHRNAEVTVESWLTALRLMFGSWSDEN